MKNEDVVVLRELAGSVYLTKRQREALARLLSRELGGAKVSVGLSAERTVIYQGIRVQNGVVSSVTRYDDGVEDIIAEDQRHALLGPCGAE